MTFDDFIDERRLRTLLDEGAQPEPATVRAIIARAEELQPLTVDEVATLLKAKVDTGLREEIFAAARKLKQRVYGNRIVIFAPLYIGNECVNDCTYCAFRRSNKAVVRQTLTADETKQQVAALEAKGHKRLILVFGEHGRYDAKYIADTVRRVYAIRAHGGEIRRVNINAAPLDEAGYRLVKEAGIGTYQVFQETYHHETYRRVHPQNTKKGDYEWRVTSLHRAIAAGCDDVGIGALFGLYDWRFEVLGLVAHANELRARFGVGPHTISFPRLRPASGVTIDDQWLVSDDDFKLLVAILRLAVPYAGLILTAREEAEIRRAVMELGVSQIDAGSKIELGGYTTDTAEQRIEREQFLLGDTRSLDEVILELLENGYKPSFCTACYRLGRTGEHFMEFAIPGFIKRYCDPNALTTLAEYLVDYASPATKEAGCKLIERELATMAPGENLERLRCDIKAILTEGAHDRYF